MTFLELCKRVRQESGISGTGPESVLNQTSILQKVVNWVQQADLDIQKKPLDWDFLWRMSNVTLVQGVTLYTAQSLGLDNMKDLDSLEYNGYPIKYFTWKQFKENRRWNDTGAGVPTEYTKRPDGTIEIYPQPKEDYTVTAEYFIKYQPMINDDDESIIPEAHHDIILQRALMYYASHEEDNGLYQVAYSQFEIDLSLMVAEHTPEIAFTGGIR